jgi:hypothetical protein
MKEVAEMDINIKDDDLQRIVNATVEKAVTESISGWDVQKHIKASATAAIMESAIAESVKASIESLDLKAISDAISKEFTRTVVSMSTLVLRTSAAAIIHDMHRGPNNYESSDQREKAIQEILARMDHQREAL